MTGRCLIDGQWKGSEREQPQRNPSDLDEVVGIYTWATLAEAHEALEAARRTLPAWSHSNPQLRSDILRKIGDALLARAEELGTLLAREEGKLRREGIAELTRSAQIFHYFSGESVRHPGQFHAGLRDGCDVLVSYESVGVVALITPWNFPMAVPAWKVAAALAYGNTVILKPSEFTPGCAVALAEIVHAAGVPAGAFNLLLGDGRLLGEALVSGADAVSFTGSGPTGAAILQQAAHSMTKVQLELGGKNPLVVLDDCNLDQAVDIALQGSYFQTGQRCTASSRLIVTRRIHDAFVAALAARLGELRIGHALDESSDIGPVNNEAQLKKNLRCVDEAKREGAELIIGGELLQRPTRGHYMQPALFAGTRNQMRINREEVFGPVASIITVEDIDEAIAVAVDCEFALSSGICTTSLAAAEKFRRASTAGMVTINAPTAGVDYHVPFGGRAPSGYGGREQGSAAAEFYTESKTTYVNHGIR